ncbi:MAG: DNA ligase [Deltaproteobacteria bacterium]|nr:DNA ligase [Deltaproteobacteria bacterium]
METIDGLVEKLKRYNEAYRGGSPLISDFEYDRLVEELRNLSPNHPFLQSIEPEKFDSKKEVRHPVPMLSTEKAYSKAQLQRFVNRVKKEADEIGVKNISYRVTPKLDGVAARDDGDVFVSRGNGEVGYEISSAFEKGVISLEARGRGLGEIVISKSYFEKHLANNFEHPRNMVVGIITSDTLNDFAKRALQDRVVRFFPYNLLPFWEGDANDLLENIENIKADLLTNTDYPVDGVVVEVTHDAVKDYMAATTHHYRWQIAYKTKGETAVTLVEDVTWQVGRAGTVTPVLEIRPVSLSGATIRRVTAHNAGLIQKKHIGRGAEIEVIRSGEVIPKLEKVIKTSDQFELPKKCPSCGTDLIWDNDFLRCSNPSCIAQIEQRISHWFKTLGNADWFGIKTIQKLVGKGYNSLEKIYPMTEEEFAKIGFGPLQSKNLMDAINISKTKPVEDWRFLAALGIPNLGKGDSRKLLSYFGIEDLFSVDAEDIEKIHGFGEVTGKSIEKGIVNIKDTIRYLLSLDFKLLKTPLVGEQESPESAIKDRRIVFTGKMLLGSRGEMEAHARRLGAKVQTAVSRVTDFLVCGENVGATKIKKAETFDVRIITESEYRDMLNG